MSRQSINLTQQQRQLQTLSPLQIRYFKMLEMTQVQAEEEVKRALDENPALEVAHDDESNLPSATDDGGFNETSEQMQLADYRGEDDIPFYRYEANNHSADDQKYIPEAVEESQTLFDILVAQVREQSLDPRLEAAVEFVAGNLDDNGYLSRSVSQMADDMAIVAGHDVSEALISEALAVVRSLDPAGVGASDLRDCLLLQLRRRRTTPQVKLAIEIVAHYFDLFSKKHFDRLSHSLGVELSDLREAVDEIKTLNPKPGGDVVAVGPDERMRHITPDFIVDTDSDMETVTVTLANRIPELQLEATFAADKSGDDGVERFIRRQRDEANGFISILKMRQQTLIAVMSAIVAHQKKFFLTGDEAMLRPMILKNISESTGYDASVVSRATSGKYVLTPWGIFPLKFFFNERFNDSDETSSREIISAIRAIIDGEDRSDPLTDEAVVGKLRAMGYEVARRTVAKYREQLGLPVARLRREI